MDEIKRVRIVSRLAALAVAAAALLTLRLAASTSTQLAPAPAFAIDVVQSAPPAPIAELVRPAPQAAPLAAPPAGEAAAALDVWLWRLGGDGAIVFDNAEQFERCAEARRHARDEADCPSARETRRLAFAG